MKRRHFTLIFLINFLLLVGMVVAGPTSPTYAARYTHYEARQVKKFQRAYHDLDAATSYDRISLFRTLPHFAVPFQAGELKPAYIDTSMAYINYYRFLFGLPAEGNLSQDNLGAQLGASALAAVNAKTSLQAHGLLGYKRPSYITRVQWATAERATLGNINFLESSTSTPGEIVTDLLQDRNNLAGAGNTGHRALLLSARATRMGIGAAYGQDNSKFYSVENGLFADDILRAPVKSIIAYPSKTVFPYELLSADTPWSIYFAHRRIAHAPKIYITDLTAKKKPKHAVKFVRNFGTDYYSEGYSAAVSFKPSQATKIINTHKYRVQVGKLYSYTFRLFREKSRLK